MNDIEKYSKTLADANRSIAIISKYLLRDMIEGHYSIEGLYEAFQEWHKHLVSLKEFVASYEELIELLIDKQ